MFDQLLVWLTEQEEALASAGVLVDLIVLPEPSMTTKFITIDYLSTDRFGRLSFFEPNLIDLEVLDFQTEERLLYQHFELEDTTQFDPIFKSFFETMSC